MHSLPLACLQEDKVAPALAMVMAVGFSREQAESALQAAQNDPDRGKWPEASSER